MSWKNFSLKLFNFAYFRLLLKRHLWLMYVPIGLYFAFLFLFLVLGIGTEGLLLMLFPYALVCVPATALIMFQYNTKKGEIAHIFSIPMTRVENFITTFLAGLVLILVPLLTLCLVNCMNKGVFYFETMQNRAHFLFAMSMLSCIYYTLSVLGCLLGGTILTQLMMMAVVSFGPLVLYLLVYFCVDFLAFGDLQSDVSELITTAFCPLISGFEMINSGHWTYFGIHLLELLITFGLCVYLARKRPIELSGQSVVFKNAQNFVLKPIFYLNIVYIILDFVRLWYLEMQPMVPNII